MKMWKIICEKSILFNKGGFGRFQLIAVSIILYPEWPAGMMDFLPVFTGKILFRNE